MVCFKLIHKTWCWENWTLSSYLFVMYNWWYYCYSLHNLYIESENEILSQKFSHQVQKTINFYRRTFRIWTFLSFFLVNDCSESALKSDFNSANCFFKVKVFLEFSSILLFRSGLTAIILHLESCDRALDYRIWNFRPSSGGALKSSTDVVFKMTGIHPKR